MVQTKSCACSNDLRSTESLREKEELEEDIRRSQSDGWTNKWDFIMACVGYACGLGNLWRFPYLCYKNGGGAFLIPYILSLVFAGIPIFLLEHSLGQLTGSGGISIWEMCPIFKGVGLATIVMMYLENTYYMQLIAWSFYYFMASFNVHLPWKDCNNWWNTEYCYRSPQGKGCASLKEGAMTLKNHSLTHENCRNPVDEYWVHNVLRRTDDITDFSTFNWWALGSLMFCWVFSVYNIFGGIKSSGKIIWFTALFPYFCLAILFVRGVTLPGAWEGIYHFFNPDFDRLRDPNVWNDASTQVFFSYGICVGAWIGLASRNKYKHNLLRDSVAICALNCATAMFAGVTVFSIIGFLAQSEGKPVENVVTSGVGLAFIVYPQAALLLPASPFWSVLFFAMLLSLGFGSVFVMVEGVFKAVKDEFEWARRNETFFATAMILSSVIIGILFNFGCGVYWFEIFNYYSASGFTILAVAFFELIGIFWVYGRWRFIALMEDMFDQKFVAFWPITWTYIGPFLCAGIFIFSLVIYTRLELDDYVYPEWAINFGWFLTLLSLIFIPAYAIYRVAITPGDLSHRLEVVTRENPHILGKILGRRRMCVTENKKIALNTCSKTRSSLTTTETLTT